jgi:hypothetical protein
VAEIFSTRFDSKKFHMRPKFVIGLVLGAVLIVSLMLLAKQRLVKPGAAAENRSADASPAAVAETAPPAETALPPLPAPVNPAPAPTTAAAMSDEDRALKIGEAIERINAALGQHDSNAVDLIMSSLTNSEKEVRDQAVMAVKQLGDRDLIPALTNLAARTENYEDRHALQEAADFIALPTVTELEQNTPPGTGPVRLPTERQRAPGQRPVHGSRRGQQTAPPGGPAAPDPGAAPGN